MTIVSKRQALLACRRWRLSPPPSPNYDWPSGPPGSGIDTFGYNGSNPDSGCGDSDGDQVLDILDNCPATFNPNQLDTDSTLDNAANQIGQQPFLRSTTGEPDGPPSEVLGAPFLRSDKWGGDACDPDMDGDMLPNDNEPNASCATGGTAVVKRDCDNDRVGDLTDYVFSSVCVSNVNFTCPGSTCLNPVNANTNGTGPLDWAENPDGDALFNFGEARLHEEDSRNGQPYAANPCTVNNEAEVNADSDGDGFKNGVERYVGTRPDSPCSSNTGLNNEQWPDSHPLDINDSRSINTIDVGAFVAHLGKSYDTAGPPQPPVSAGNHIPAAGVPIRLDFGGAGPNLIINTIDVGRYVAALGDTC